MMASPTPAERAAIRTGYAALASSTSPTSYLVEQVVYALGAAQQLMDPEIAEELRTLRARVAELVEQRDDALVDLVNLGAAGVVADRDACVHGVDVRCEDCGRCHDCPDARCVPCSICRCSCQCAERGGAS